MAVVKRNFLGWDKPLPELGAEFLIARDGAGEGSLIDLSDALVIVQTRQAARSLKSYLAEIAREQSLQLTPPLIVPPHFLLNLGTEALPAASRIELLLAWVKTLRDSDLGECPAVFPVPPTEQDYAWASRVGRLLLSVQQGLGEVGLSIADAAQHLGDDSDYPEPDRWQQLAQLELAMDQVLADEGLLSPQQARQAALSDGVHLPAEIGRVFVIGAPDPVKATIPILEQIAATEIPIEVAVFAPESMTDKFDSWGRPLPEYWSRDHRIAIDEARSPINLVTRPAIMADGIAELASQVNAASDQGVGESLTIGALDEEANFFLKRELAEREIPHFDPGGASLESTGFYSLLRALANFLAGGRFDDYLELVRHTDFQRSLVPKKNPDEFDVADLLRRFDRLREKFLPGSLEEVKILKDDEKWRSGYSAAIGLNRGLDLLRDFRKEPLAECLPKFLSRIYAKRDLGSDDLPATRAIRDGGRALMQALDAFGDNPLAASACEDSGELLSAVLDTIAAEPVFTEKEPGAVEFYGWLELFWDDRPWLAIAGANEGMLPDVLNEDTFLTPQVRRSLGMVTDEERHARDAYLLESMLQWRRENGRVEFFVTKTSQDGSPNQPSRLLFACDDAQLDARVENLFRGVDEPAQNHPWSTPWLLDPFGIDLLPIETMRVTDFRNYLRCPLEFYLGRALGLWGSEPDKRELANYEFGNFCHAVLEVFGQDETVRDSHDADTIQAFLLAAADRIATETWGANPPAAIALQLVSAKRRLEAFASRQASHRAAGWRIHSIEQVIEDKLPGWNFGGMPVRGKIDRIDYHEGDDRWLVLDYKTSTERKKPEPAHTVAVNANTNLAVVPDYARFSLAGKEKRWTDLQLPIYALALREWESIDAKKDVSCGYFMLPASIDQTDISIWKALKGELLEAAAQCAESICSEIQNGVFWPPRTDGGDRLESVLFKAPTKTIAPPPAYTGGQPA